MRISAQNQESRCRVWRISTNATYLGEMFVKPDAGKNESCEKIQTLAKKSRMHSRCLLIRAFIAF